jgi:cell division protein ZapE
MARTQLVTELQHGRDICARTPEIVPTELIGELFPPREFENSSFDNYRPDEKFPSQAQARDKASEFVGASKRGLFAKKSKIDAPGLYLDGGFGVGKTHLLAAMYHSFSGSKLFGSFMAFTSLVGALGFAKALETLGQFEFIAIDEFELDDPGNTMIMSRLLNELSQKGTKFAATSNTPPNALGEGRFAAADFQREILGIGRQFLMLRVDGEDFRHRPVDANGVSYAIEELQRWVTAETATADFETLLKKLGTVHPALYGKLLAGDQQLAITNVNLLTDQNDALRFVSLVDRAYELQIKIRGTGIPLTEIFPSHFLDGGYRKKYLRAVSRLGALSS